MVVTRTPEMLVWTKVALPGFHRWPNAHEERKYLRDRHRHLFHITVWTEVHHDERDVEFHDLQDVIREWWGPGAREWDASSCETIARELATHLYVSHDTLAYRIDVSEDGESGATYTPKDNS